MLRGWQTLTGAVLDLLFPPSCIVCNADGAWICQACRSQIAYIPVTNQGRIEGKPLGRHDQAAVDGFYAVSYHDGVLREAIHQFKYEGVRALASPLSALLADFYSEHALFADMLIPVPLHPRRQRERGYNQSNLLAQALGQIIHLPVNANILQRVKYTLPQVGLNAEERQENVIDAFRCVQAPNVEHVMLIDDVCTTGATLSACALVLKEQGARHVWALTLARPRGVKEINVHVASRQ